MIATAKQSAPSHWLFWVLVLRQLKLWRKRSRLGTLWPIASPFFLMVLFVFVFRRVFQVPIERYPEYLLCGLLPWAFLTQSLGRTIASISSEPELIRKAPFRYELIPLSSAAAHGLNFVLTVALFVAYLAVVGHLPYDTLPVLVFPVLATILLVMSLSMLVALIDVYNHDLQLVLGNLLTVWFFLVPVLYRPQMAPEALHFLRSVDPMNLIVTQMRAVLYHGNIQSPPHLIGMLTITVGLFAVSLLAFRRFSRFLPQDV